jgi:hypothetical protein
VSIILSNLKHEVTELWLDVIEAQIRREEAREAQEALARTMDFKNARIDQVFNVILGNYGLNAPTVSASDSGDNGDPFDFTDFSLPGG